MHSVFTITGPLSMVLITVLISRVYSACSVVEAAMKMNSSCADCPNDVMIPEFAYVQYYVPGSLPAGSACCRTHMEEVPNAPAPPQKYNVYIDCKYPYHIRINGAAVVVEDMMYVSYEAPYSHMSGPYVIVAYEEGNYYETYGCTMDKDLNLLNNVIVYTEKPLITDEFRMSMLENVTSKMSMVVDEPFDETNMTLAFTEMCFS